MTVVAGPKRKMISSIEKSHEHLRVSPANTSLKPTEPKRKPGRPKKQANPVHNDVVNTLSSRVSPANTSLKPAEPKRKPGRPKKQANPVRDDVVNTMSEFPSTWDEVRAANIKRNMEFMGKLGLPEVLDRLDTQSRKVSKTKRAVRCNSDSYSESSAEGSDSEDDLISELSSCSDSRDISYTNIEVPDGCGEDKFWAYIGKSFRDFSDGEWKVWKITAVCYSVEMDTYFWKYVSFECVDEGEDAEYTPCRELLDDQEVQWFPDENPEFKLSLRRGHPESSSSLSAASSAVTKRKKSRGLARA